MVHVAFCRWGADLWQNVASDYGAFMKKYNETNQRILTQKSESRDIASTVRTDVTNRGAVVLMLVDTSSHKVRHLHLTAISQC